VLTRRKFLYSSAVAALGLKPALAQTHTGQPAPVVSDRARAIHQRAFIFDAHVHALDREFYHGGSMGTRFPDGQWDLPRAREGGEDAFFLSIYVPEEYYPSRFETRQALRRVDHAIRQLHVNATQIELALNAPDIERIPSRTDLQRTAAI
jgi:membrane dipeptidase